MWNSRRYDKLWTLSFAQFMARPQYWPLTRYSSSQTVSQCLRLRIYCWQLTFQQFSKNSGAFMHQTTGFLSEIIWVTLPKIMPHTLLRHHGQIPHTTSWIQRWFSPCPAHSDPHRSFTQSTHIRHKLHALLIYTETRTVIKERGQ